MGVTIHYKGKLNQPELINEFCEEMKDISKAMEWDYYLINNREDLQEIKLKGIIIIPHKESEPLVLTVDPEGILRNAFMMKFVKEEPELTFINHIKTQFAPPEVHIAVIKLLKYIHKKYVFNLDVYDEGGYWATENPALVKERIDFLNSKMDALRDISKSFKIDTDDSPETIADKMEQLLNNTLMKSQFQKKKKKK